MGRVSNLAMDASTTRLTSAISESKDAFGTLDSQVLVDQQSAP